MRLCIGLLLLGLSLVSAPAGAEWRRAESPNFVLYANESESRLRERILLLENFEQLLRMLSSGEEQPGPKLHVYFVSGIDDLRVIRPLPDGIAGIYTPSDEGIAAFVDGRAEGRGTEILFHEYAHHFMAQHMAAAYPAWYVEGFADYLATVRFTRRRIEIGHFSEGRIYQLREGGWLPLDRVLSGGTGGLNGEAMSAFYAQSWLLVHYFYSSPERQAAGSRLLGALSRGADPAEAVEAATGLNLQAFTQELRDYLLGRLMARQAAPFDNAPPSVTITSMPAAADDLILYEAALRVGIPEENQQAHLQRVRSLAARHPEDPLAMQVRAHAEVLYGNAEAADGLLDRLLATREGDAQLLYLKGLRYLKAAESDDPPEGAAATARTWFARARAADPNHFQSLVRYVESLRGEGEYTEEMSEMLVQATRLAPQVASIALNAAAVLMTRGEYQQAIELLAPLAANPHDASLADAARQMMNQAASMVESGSRFPKKDAEEATEAEPAAD
jgi:hypothetical protein